MASLDSVPKEDSPIIAAIDIGTSYAKVGLVDLSGNLLNSARERLELIVDEHGKAEHDVGIFSEKLISMLTKSVQGFQDRIVGIVVSTYLLGLMVVDESFRPITNMITLADTRTRRVVDELFGRILDPEQVYRRTGFPPTFHSPLVKLFWLSKLLKVDRELKKVKFLSAKDLALLTLTGKAFTDLSTASATSMFNVETMRWDEEILGAVGVGPEQLSEILPIDARVQLADDIAESCGLKSGTPVVVGTYDGGAVGLSAGVLARRVCSVNLGTTSMARVVTGGPVIAGNFVLKVQNVALDPNIWFPGSSVNNAGIVVEWFKNTFGWDPKEFQENSLSEMYLDKKLLVFPYLTGERGFSFGSNAFGAIVGLEVTHGREHLYVAGLEGICFSLKLGLDLLSESGVSFERIVVSGSGARSRLWLSVLANVAGKVIEVDTSPEPGLVGSAILGFYATGFYRTISESTERLTTGSRYEIAPNEKLVSFYVEKYERFKKELAKLYTF